VRRNHTYKNYDLWDARELYDDKKQSLRVWFYFIAENVARDVRKRG
jgi:hypothetical protein